MTTAELPTIIEPSPESVPPLIDARNLSVAGHRGAIFTDVTFTAPHNSVTVVVGEAGSGRTSLLLALAGRFVRVSGELMIDGVSARSDPSRVQRRVAVARALPGIVFDKTLRVQEVFAEERALNAPRVITETLGATLSLFNISAPWHSLIEDLPPDEQLLFSVALAAARAPHAIVVDDVDEGLTPVQRDRVWQGFRSLADVGVSVIASATSTAYQADTVVQL